jgi:Acetyltransferase (GNAT) domain
MVNSLQQVTMRLVADSDRSAANGDVESFARTHVGVATTQYVANLDTRVELIGAADHRVPVTVNLAERDNAWVCSPYTAYCAYAIEELQRLMPWAVAFPLTALCRAAGAALRHADIDQAVTINNWLLSTNLYPGLQHGVLKEWIGEARDRWPSHAIWFRSLNDAWTPDWLAALSAEGAILLPSRQVYLFSDVASLARGRPNLKADLKLLAGVELQRCDDADIQAADYARIEHLYSKLYLQKYSHLNPAYRASFVAAWHRAGLLKLTGFRDRTGVLQAVVGTFEREGVVTAPLVGYDTSLPQKIGLYRLLMAAVLKYAADSGQRVNLSAGAAQFKRLRGGVPTIEYSAVLVNHLPAYRQRALRGLRWLTAHVGVPLMTRFKL